ncbi:MAG TPA: type IV secretory system conjugative DNA transfer family protein [Candidatus Binataceae bacterium]|nr:type IV secretory system conjugative DNA transfer family protein [Candidatus Binataceae bacterium]
MAATSLPYRPPGNPAPNRIATVVAVTAGLIAFLALWAATQRAAAMLGYATPLGEPVTTLPLVGPLYAPWAILLWAWKWRNAGEASAVFASAMRLFEYPSTAAALLAMGAARLVRGIGPRIHDLHGSAHWANAREVKSTGLRDPASGVYVGAWRNGRRTYYLRDGGPAHVLAFAPTRSGKGAGIVVPTLLDWPESVVVHDIKGENWALTAGWRRRSLGNLCFRFDPTCTDGKGAHLNPLCEVRIGDEEVKDAQNIADTLVDPSNSAPRDHWDLTAHDLLTAVILHVLYTGQEKTLARCLSFLAPPDRSQDDALKEMSETRHPREITHAVIAGAAHAVMSKSPNERASVLSTAVRCLSLYRDPIVAANTADSDFALADLMHYERPVSLYLTVPPSDLTRTRPLMRLLLAQLGARLTERLHTHDGSPPQRRLLLMLDEFPALGRLDFLQTALSYAAGYGIKACLIAQDLSQLYAAYGKDESIISNCAVRVAFAPNKIETARLVSEMAGVATVRHEHRTYSAGGTSVSEPATQRPLLTSDEAMRLPEDAALIFVAGHPPIYASKIRYFEDRDLDARTKIPTPLHSDRIEHEHQRPEPPPKAVITNGDGANGKEDVAHADQSERGSHEREKGELSKEWPFA